MVNLRSRRVGRPKAVDVGRTLPHHDRLDYGAEGIRQRVLLECLDQIDARGDEYHSLAKANLARWKDTASSPPPSAPGVCAVRVLPGDWGAVTHSLTKQFGETFACLNMANAFGPGGGYVEGMVAQEENMFRRTDCHFSLDRAEMDMHTEEYLPEHTNLLSAANGRVYLDVQQPRVCIRGPEDRQRDDLGYAWLANDEVFPFYELRAAAVDLRDYRKQYDHAETVRRVSAQLDTLIEHSVRYAVLSAFGCGAFQNPAHEVAAAYREALDTRASHFDVVAFAIFHAGYGPNNFQPFADAFADWPGTAAEQPPTSSSSPRTPT
jgi:hypothetical protein